MSVAETSVSTAKKTSAQDRVVTMKITLRGSKPPIWRRVVIPSAATLADLHLVIQCAMGWTGGHMHAFDVHGRQYGDRRSWDEVADERRLTVNGLVKSGTKRFSYTYDFGDDWEHILTIEKVDDADTTPSRFMCIAGKRACPPDDCGGLWGYYHLLEVLADPTHPEHKEQRDWFEDDIEPEAFDIGGVNARLAFLDRKP